MDYGVGSRIRVKVRTGQIVEPEISAIVTQSAGRKIALVNPAQIIEVLK